MSGKAGGCSDTLWACHSIRHREHSELGLLSRQLGGTHPLGPRSSARNKDKLCPILDVPNPNMRSSRPGLCQGLWKSHPGLGRVPEKSPEGTHPFISKSHAAGCCLSWGALRGEVPVWRGCGGRQGLQAPARGSHPASPSESPTPLSHGGGRLRPPKGLFPLSSFSHLQIPHRFCEDSNDGKTAGLHQVAAPIQLSRGLL